MTGTSTPPGNTAREPVIVAPGKILDYIDGITQRADTPEEYVRQEIAKSLVREYGYAKSDIQLEWPLKFGSQRVRADLAIFPPDHPHNQDNVLSLVECKKASVRPSDRKEGVDQLKSYLSACPNATYGMWTNGTDRECFRIVARNGRRVPEPIPDLPRFGTPPEDEDRPEFDQLRPAASDSLLFAFRRCHDYIAGNQGLQKPEAFWELLKLIFCKIHDERRSDRPQFYAAATERSTMGAPACKKRIGRLFAAVRKEFPEIFRNEDLELQPVVLSYLVSQLQMFALLDSDIDVKGKAYEEVVGSNLRGDRGEFFTPRNICTMIVEILDPQENQLIVDPACGTGGFLITAMNHVVKHIEDRVNATRRSQRAKQESATAQKNEFLQTKLVGIDFNPSLVRAAKMNMVMNNDGEGGIYQGNSLVAPALWSEELRGRDLVGNVDLIMTKPPFGSKIPIDDPAILDRFDLGHQWSYHAETDEWNMGTELRSRPPEILFIERCVELLKPGIGIAAMVLPDGILGSPGLGYVREWLLQRTQILASIDLHADTFQPSTSVQTSVLVFRRKSSEELHAERLSGRQEEYQVFMAICDHIGHDKRGNEIYVRDRDGNEVLVDSDDIVTELINGQRIERKHTQKVRLVDDNTREIARSFRLWLEEQG